MRDKTIVEHWKYHDGWYDIPNVLQDSTLYPAGQVREFREELKGWHCWVYPTNDSEFVAWMENNMKGAYECDFKYNSGDPMHLVIIKEDEDATLFKIRWM
jgi:hypothetical protein